MIPTAAEKANLEKNLWKCGDQWLPIADADTYHSELLQWWRIPYERFILQTTCDRDTANLKVKRELENGFDELVRAYVQAHLVDREALAQHQDANDALMALQTLKQAFTCDVSPILATARRRAGGAIDPVAAFRASGYRDIKTHERQGQVRQTARAF